MRFSSSILLCLLLLPLLTEAATVRLEIRHLWEGEPLELPGSAVTTAAAEQLRYTRLAYLLSEPGFVSASEEKTVVRKDWNAFVNAENTVSELSLEGVPSGEYARLQFFIGPDPATDESDPNQYPPRHPLNPLVNNLHWTPQGGYIYFALEGKAEGGLGFSYHLGTGRNRVLCEIPLRIRLEDAATISIDFHLDRLFQGAPSWATQTQTSTHSREGDPVASLLKKRLSTVFTIREIRQSVEVPEIKHEVTLDQVGTPYSFRLKNGFPIPELPSDYPLTNERVELGERLFHETLLSRNESISCASCHQSEHAFSDPRPLSMGVSGETGTRNSMSLLNLAWKNSFFWDGRKKSLREQVLEPIENPFEMNESIENVAKKLAGDPNYPGLFAEAFGSREVSGERIAIAMEQFLLTLTSFDSKFDQARRGETTLTQQEQRGLELFMTEFDPRRGLHGADCFHCHGGPFFTLHQFHNNGLVSTGDIGLEGVTSKETDRGKFVSPSLRNIALSAPYMHDGRFETLEEVIDHYTSGVRRSGSLDPNLAKHPEPGIPLPEEDKIALVAFLQTLTDEQFAPPLP
ncbi:MAG: cytochrome c peroxidase [Verrucomicrobiales bacterium]|nr:cytochrome c peroxidase [Verrucomicrobiales bacterium]